MSGSGLEKYKADGVLWVNAGPATCLERIKKRSREGENAIMLEYLETCDKYHREWLGIGNVFLVEDIPDWDGINTFLF
jgi:deoxyadenosine/deoxycytidine kinase